MKIKVLKKANHDSGSTYCPFMIDMPPDLSK